MRKKDICIEICERESLRAEIQRLRAAVFDLAGALSAGDPSSCADCLYTMAELHADTIASCQADIEKIGR